MARKILNGLDLASQRIVNLADPSSAQDAATKNYADSLGGGGGGELTRQTASYTTASLNPNATETGAITLAKGYRLLKLTTNRPARVRVYDTAAHRTADAARPIGTDPTGNHGVMLEYVSTVSVLAASLAPQVDGYNGEASPNDQIPLSITNKDGSTGTVTVDLVFLQTEPVGGGVDSGLQLEDTTDPEALGTAEPGAATTASASDHVHPTTGLATSGHGHAPGGWHEVGAGGGEPAFENSWTNHATGTVERVAFRKDAFDVVWLKGMPQNGTMNTTIFTLPTGYRPSEEINFTAMVGAGGTAVCRIKVNTDGTVTQANSTSNNAPTLSSCRFWL